METPVRAAILGTGSYVPGAVLTNEQVTGRSGGSPDWVSENLGIRERRIVAAGELTSDMATRAGKHALAAAGLDPGDIDLVVLATATPDRLAPATACIVHENLQTRNAAAFDINAVCSGFMFGLATASSYITGMGFRHVLVIGADCFSRFTDWDRRDAVFFGDGAGAAVLGRSVGDEGFRAFRLGSDGEGWRGFTIAAGGSENPPEATLRDPRLRHFQMNAQDVYGTATRALPLAIRQVLEDCRLDVSDIDHLVPHQASMKVLRAVANELDLPLHKVRTNMASYANTSSATIPILLDESLRTGAITGGQTVLFASVGSGWTWGSALYKT